MNSGTQTHNISGQAHPVSISIQPGFALLDKADSSSRARSEASLFPSLPMFLLQCWNYLRLWRFHSFACLPAFLWRNVHITSYCEFSLPGILFCKTKKILSDRHPLCLSTSSVYLSEQLYLTLHVGVLVFGACWFITYLISWRRGIYMWKLHVWRCCLAPLWGLSMDEWGQGEQALRVLPWNGTNKEHTWRNYWCSALEILTNHIWSHEIKLKVTHINICAVHKIEPHSNTFMHVYEIKTGQTWEGG